jgi:hypothetical protein
LIPNRRQRFPFAGAGHGILKQELQKFTARSLPTLLLLVLQAFFSAVAATSSNQTVHEPACLEGTSKTTISDFS